MENTSTTARAMKPGIKLEDESIVGYESADEIDASNYQVVWTNVMAEGRYLSPSVYKKVEVLLLCWKEHSRDIDTQEEVERLKSVFKEGFGYNVTIQQLDATREKKLQLQVNANVANFAEVNDGPDTLLIVYYAGHGKPGEFFGELELIGQSSPNDSKDDAKKRARNRVVWNKTEELLRPAEADVLEIFDCCYAGTIGLTRGENRLFEYLAATKDQKTTKVPGPKSFTSALAFALEALRKEKPKGRFTTDELLRKIKTDAPNFPKDQTPTLSDREHRTSSGGRIMLHPLQPEPMEDDRPPAVDPLALPKGHIVTLHFDFGDKPSEENLIILGRNLNEIFERNTLEVHRVRLGEVRSTAFARATRRFSTSRKRRLSGRGRPSGQWKHLSSSSSESKVQLDGKHLSPQSAAFETLDSMDSGSPSSLMASSAPTSDMEKEPDHCKAEKINTQRTLNKTVGNTTHNNPAKKCP